MVRGLCYYWEVMNKGTLWESLKTLFFQTVTNLQQRLHVTG